MKKIKKHSYPGTQIGISFLLVVFIILCLTIFATLSLSGALRDNEYSQKAAERTTDYYHACSDAQVTLSEIDQILQDAASVSKDSDTYLAYITKKISQNQKFRLNTDTIPATISYEEKINASQTLQIVLQLENEASVQDIHYKIVRWKETSSRNWEDKTTLPVLGSNSKETD